DRDAALLDQIALHVPGRAEAQPQADAVLAPLAELAHGVDVTLHDVATIGLARPQRVLEVDSGARPEAAERRAAQRLGYHLERERIALDRHDREAAARDVDGVADLAQGREHG